MRLKPTYALFLSLGMLVSTSAVLAGCNAPSTSQTPDQSAPMGDDMAMDDESMPMGDTPMSDGSMTDSMTGSMTMDLGPKDADFDLRFIDGMMLHHQGAINMAETALQNSQRAEMKQLAQEIIAAQQGEMEQMQQWRQAWYPNASADPAMYDAQMGHSMMMSDEMQANMRMDGDLGEADDEFDLRFINAMVAHHEGALEMAEQALKNSDRPEVKQLSEDIVTSQQAEIDQMTEWKKEWYNL